MIMEWITTIQLFFERMESRRFMQYAVGLVAAVFLLYCGATFLSYRSIRNLARQLDEVNEQRSRVQELLERAEQVKHQRKRVDKMLSESEGFKIGGYFKEIVQKLRLSNKKTTEAITPRDREDNYREVNLNATFTGMSMQELVELLHEIGKTERIYTTELSITRGKRDMDTIDVALTIGTLLAKIAEGPEIPE